jgi:hypothetical protein
MSGLRALPGCEVTMFVRELRVGSGDFFKTQMRTPREETFLIASLTCHLKTNSEAILRYARKHFIALSSDLAASDVTFRFWVDGAVAPQPASEKPHFRGVGGIVFASFNKQNFLVMNLAKRCVIGRFTQDFVEDEAGLARTVFPIAIATLGPANGISVIHSACIVDKQQGLLLAGASGSGKSTLSLALRQLGYECLSDDRTYISSRHGRLLCWGAGGRLKLRPEAAKHFPHIPMVRVADSSGPETFEVDLAQNGPSRRHCSEPGWIVFLEPKEGARLELTALSPSDAAARLEEGVLQESEAAIQCQLDVTRKLAKRPCYICRYSGSPQVVARALADRFFSTIGKLPVALYETVEVSEPSLTTYRDPLRRFTPLVHRIPIRMMGRNGMFETNSIRVSESAYRFLKSSLSDASSRPAFTWRIVTEEGQRPKSPWPQPTGLAAEGMRCVNLGQTGFVAANLDACEVVGFTSESRVADAPGFAGVFLAAMAHLTAAALRLTPISSACIAKQKRGLLLLGPPGRGKTTCAYAARKFGFEIHSDMATFLEVRGGRLHAWGEFWPALFRQETARFHPELLHLGQPLEHENETFISVEKSCLTARDESNVIPILALVLERGKAKIPRLTQLIRAEYLEILKASCPYAEEPQNRSHRSAVLAELLTIPAYKLAFGEDPTEAAIFCRSLFTTHRRLEGLR